MSQDREPHVILSAEADNQVQYRTVNWTAVASLLLGLLSATAIASKPMWCVPIVGITLAIIALWSLSRSDSGVLGRGAASVGLALSLLFKACAVTGHLVRQQTLRREARPHTTKWIEMVRNGQLREAHQLYLPQRERQPLGANLKKHYDDVSGRAQEEIDVFFNDPPLSKIIELGQQGQLRYVGDEGVSTFRESGASLDMIVQQYAIDYEVEGMPETLSFVVSISRQYDSEHGEARWRVREVTEPGAARW